MRWPWVSRALYDFVKERLIRVENENRQLLSALLEHTVSREAGMMLREPGEIEVALQDFKQRAAARYQASRPHPSDSPVSQGTGDSSAGVDVAGVDLRHWRDARSDRERQTFLQARAETSNDSVDRIEHKVKAAREARL